MAWDDSASKIWMDGNMVDWKDAKIHALSHVSIMVQVFLKVLEHMTIKKALVFFV